MSVDVAQESPLTEGVAGRYAGALFELAKEQGALPQVEAELNTFQSLLDLSEDLRRLVRSPVFSAEDQAKALAAVLGKTGIGGLTANFLGLSNAATPLGLKAMEELNKLNPVAGTATNAMCMFLTINTTALTLVPATVIAIRLTLGSTNPTDIIMPTFLATLVSLILGIAFTRMIQRFFPIKEEAA